MKTCLHSDMLTLLNQSGITRMRQNYWFLVLCSRERWNVAPWFLRHLWILKVKCQVGSRWHYIPTSLKTKTKHFQSPSIPLDTSRWERKLVLLRLQEGSPVGICTVYFIFSCYQCQVHFQTFVFSKPQNPSPVPTATTLWCLTPPLFKIHVWSWFCVQKGLGKWLSGGGNGE